MNSGWSSYKQGCRTRYRVFDSSGSQTHYFQQQPLITATIDILNNIVEREPDIGSYGHYKDELVKTDGQWLFRKRTIYNETGDEWMAPPGNPCW